MSATAISSTLSKDEPLWVFTPSRTSTEALEFILVQREELLKDAVERIRESALTDHKHYLLFVGPRGCGKTHLTTLLVARLGQQEELADRLRIAWLNEDETCTSLLDLLLKIHAALEKRYPQEYQSSMLDEAYARSAKEALNYLKQHLVYSLGEKTLLLAVENLDAIFDGLGESGQKQLRAFLQENPKVTIAATAQRLVEDLSQRTSPFFGFFQTEHLKPLSIEQATDLLSKIASLRQEASIVEFLSTRRGRSRVRALHHLSGGNHRIYIVLGQFISQDSFEALVAPFLEMVDELTPYYQERLRWLPPLQRKIIEYLCSREGTVPVKEIAQRLFSSHPTISKQLQELREKGYVEANSRGRESLYEVSEPLMRICIEVKDNQNREPLRSLVNFLRVWYDQDELSCRLEAGELTSVARSYMISALEKNRIEGSLRRKIFIKELAEVLPKESGVTIQNKILKECERLPEGYTLAWKSWAEGSANEAISFLADALMEASDSATKSFLLLRQASFHEALGDFSKAVEDYTILIRLSGLSDKDIARTLINRGVAYGNMNDICREIADYTAAIEWPNASVDQVTKALLNRAITYGQEGDVKREMADYTAVIELRDAPIEHIAKALVNRGVAYGQMGDKLRAIFDYALVINSPSAPVEQITKALLNRGVAYGEIGDFKNEISDYTALVEMPNAPIELIVKALLNRGITYGQMADVPREIADYTAILKMPNIPVELIADALLNRSVAYGKTGDIKREIADCTTLIGLPNIPNEQVASALFNRAIAYGKMGNRQSEIADYTTLIELPNIGIDRLANALFNRAVTHKEVGDGVREISDYTAAIELTGAPVGIVSQALLNRGAAYWLNNDTEQAITNCTTLIELQDAPIEQIASAYLNRAMVFLKEGRQEGCLKDLKAVIALENAPSSSFLKACLRTSIIFLSKGRWSEGYDFLRKALARGGQETSCYSGEMMALIHTIFNAGLSIGGRLEKARELLAIFEEFNVLTMLGGYLIKQTGGLFRKGKPFPSEDNLDQWAKVWEEAAEGHEELRIPLRLFHTVIAYIKAKGEDPGVLLDLTSAERTIVKQALGLREAE